MRTMKVMMGSAVIAALILAGCSGSAHHGLLSHLHASPSSSAMVTLTNAEQSALPKVEACVPNGRAVLPSVLSGHASLLTDYQLGKSFKSRDSRHRIFTCLFPKNKEKRSLKQAENCVLTAIGKNGIGHGKGRADLVSALQCTAKAEGLK